MGTWAHTWALKILVIPAVVSIPAQVPKSIYIYITHGKNAIKNYTNGTDTPNYYVLFAKSLGTWAVMAVNLENTGVLCAQVDKKYLGASQVSTWAHPK